MAGVRKSYSKSSLEELLQQEEEIKSEIKSRRQNHPQEKPLTRRLSDHSFLTQDSSQPSVQSKVKQLLQFIVYGNQAEAEKMLVSNPQILPTLLTQKAEVIDYSGRKILGTALQLAMGAKDVRYHKDEERMVEMLEEYYQKLPDPETVMSEQITEQFPEGFEKQEEKRRKRDSEALHKVYNDIANLETDKEIDKAIQDFVDYLKLQTLNTITSGYHSNDQLLLEAFKLYDQNYERFGRSPPALFPWRVKNNDYWCKVIGNIERYVTACDAQALCQGIYNIVGEKEKLTRSLTFRYNPTVKFYPLDSDPHFRLGNDYGALCSVGAVASRAPSIDSASFEYFCRTKNINAANFYFAHTRPLKVRAP